MPRYVVHISRSDGKRFLINGHLHLSAWFETEPEAKEWCEMIIRLNEPNDDSYYLIYDVRKW